MQHAGALPSRINTVFARSEQECLLQRINRARDRIGAREWAEIVAAILFAAAIFEHLRRIMVTTDQNVREGFIVPQQDIESRFQRFD